MVVPITTIDEFEEEYNKGIGVKLPVRGGRGRLQPFVAGRALCKRKSIQRYHRSTDVHLRREFGNCRRNKRNYRWRRLTSANFPMNYVGGEIDFIRPIWRGDRIHAEESILGARRKQSDRIGEFCICTAMVEYYNQRLELVATKKTNMARYKNLGGGKTMEYDRETKSNVVETAPGPLVFERVRRGNQTRVWDDVVEGEAIPTLSKGTYTVTELFLFTHGVVGTGRSPRAALDAEESTDLGGGGRYDAKHAKNRRNMPGQFDWGPQRVCWLCQIATDCAGDDTTVKRMDTRVRHPNIVGDTNTVYGNVVGKYERDGERLADLHVWNENRSGLHTAECTITVALSQ